MDFNSLYTGIQLVNRVEPGQVYRAVDLYPDPCDDGKYYVFTLGDDVVVDCPDNSELVPFLPLFWDPAEVRFTLVDGPEAAEILRKWGV